MGKDYPLSVSRSNILGTEAFRNLLGKSLKKSRTRIVILSAYVKKIGIMFSGTSSYFPYDFETTIGFFTTFILLSTNFVVIW